MAIGELNTMSRAACVACLMLLLGSAFAQTAPAPLFEVASVKPSNPRVGPIGLFNYPGGRISGNGLTLEMLISEAFHLTLGQISGGPAWIRKDTYAIEAKPAASSRVSTMNPSSPRTPLSDEQRFMLQGLLADRFRLKVHRENKEANLPAGEGQHRAKVGKPEGPKQHFMGGKRCRRSGHGGRNTRRQHLDA